MEKYLNKDTYEKLKKELEYLETTKRKQAAEQLKRAASFGDLSENAAYNDAKDVKSFLEGKIDQLRDLLRSAKIVDMAQASFVSIGSKVTIEADQQETKLEIVSPVEANPLAGRISYESPLGKALIGKKPGQTAQVETSNGNIKYKVKKID